MLLLVDVPIPAIGVLYRFLDNDRSWRVERTLHSRRHVKRAAIAVGVVQHRIRNKAARRFPALRRVTRRG